ncbi:PQQ-binding-like beta-propeller repeat protein [Blastococcus montanus]|uniref:outer membrane protein assembly factor BamB family protein n=1 Tax=Blastococcus montanus TaxID=3144973 RepID=UPI00320A305B
MAALRPGRPPLRAWIWAAATAVLAVVAVLLWRGSDAAATDSTTAPPADVPPGTPAGAVSEVWSVPGDPLPDDVVEDGRVLVGSAHGVRALDPVTGEQAWHYVRSNARLCGLTATDGIAVAVFRTEDRCDEAVGLDAGTGVRAWTRNVNFRPDVTLRSTGRVVLARSPGGVVALDPTGNNIRWRYQSPSGCRLLGSDVGDVGVVVLERCDAAPARVRAFDGIAGDVLWTRDVPSSEGGQPRLLGADLLVGVLAGDDVQLLSGTDGALLRSIPAGEDRSVAQTAVDGAVLVRSGDVLTAFHPTSAQELWAAPATGLPGEPVAGSDGRSVLTVPEAGGFVRRDAGTGEELGRSEAAGLPADATATAVGPAVVLRLADRVLGHR